MIPIRDRSTRVVMASEFSGLRSPSLAPYTDHSFNRFRTVAKTSRGDCAILPECGAVEPVGGLWGEAGRGSRFEDFRPRTNCRALPPAVLLRPERY